MVISERTSEAAWASHTLASSPDDNSQAAWPMTDLIGRRAVTLF